MGSKYRNSFFDSKREWSKYKDSVLDYYLVPYLEKVKQLRKPVCVVDMFAGRGEFKSGEPGSPLIIAARLQELAPRHPVKLLCYENYPPFYSHLAAVLKPFAFAEALPKDCFSDVTNIAQLASTHTMLLYVDPCDVVQLSLSKLGLVFEKVRQNSSVEALIVFMASAFMRQAAATDNVEMQLNESGALYDPLVQDAEEDDKAMWLDALYDDKTASQYQQSQKYRGLLTDIAGGNYWEAIIKDSKLAWEEKCASLVDEYRQKLRSWFRLVEALPVHSDTSALPKYWMTFMTRYEPAFDLFNGAACSVVRAQRRNVQNKPGMLFAEIDAPPEMAAEGTVDRAVKRTARPLPSCKWNELRWRTCGNRNVGKFTQSEVNQSIKRLLKTGWLRGASGDKIEEDSVLSPTPELQSWVDR